jgi:fibronectin type 3 domain-containing protein
MKRILLIVVPVLMFSGAAVANDYYVNAATGSDTPGNGSLASPWKTITYALDHISGTGHTLYVAPGTYNISLGETFPILMKNSVSLVGSDATTCILDAVGSDTTLIRCVSITDATTRIEGLTLKNGGSSVKRGGMFLSAGSVPTVTKCIITANTNGAIYIDNSSPRIATNVIAKNTSSSNSIYAINCVSSSHARIINNTVSDNSGGIFIDNASPDSIENNIISYSTYYGIFENSVSSDPGRVAYNLFYQNSSGVYRDENTTDYFTASSLNGTVSECTANLDGDPKFVNRANADYRLLVGSAAFDAGNPDAAFNDPDGTRGDIGALYLDAPPSPPANLTAVRGNAQVQLIWNRNPEPDMMRYRVYYGASPAPTTKMDSTATSSDTTRTYVLLNNTTYYFRVTAVDAAGNESGSSNEVNATPMAAVRGEYLPDTSTALLLHFNESSGDTAYDASGNGNAGIATGTTIVEGRYGKARRFNGGDQVTAQHSASLNVGTGNFTLEMWFFLGSSGAGGGCGKNGPSTGYSLGFHGESGVNIRIDIPGQSVDVWANGNFVDGKWHHVAGVRSDSVLSIYIDGILRNSASFTGVWDLDNTASMNIGSGPDLDLDEVRLSHCVRSPSEFDVQVAPKTVTANASGTSIALGWQNGGGLAPFMRYRIYRGTDSTNVALIDSTTQLSFTSSGLANGTRYFYRVSAVDSSGYEYSRSYAANAVTAPALGEYAPDANTVLLLHMNETIGSAVTDASASNDNGSASGTTFVNGKFGKCRAYTSSGDQVNIPNSSALNFGTGSFTLETWINTQGYTNDGGHPFYKFGSPDNRGWHTQIYSDGTTGGYIANGSDQNGSGFSGRTKINDGKWHHIAVVFTQTYITTYIDGVFDNVSTVWASGTPDNDGTLNIGSSWNGFRGFLDEIRISNKARTPSEFNLQLPPKNCSASASGSSITLNWHQGGGLTPMMRYRIYRGTDSVNVTLIDSTTALTYQDIQATAGTFYFYRIAAVDSTGFEGAKTNALYSQIRLAGEYAVDTSTVFLMHLNQTGGINVGDVSRNGFHGQFNGGSFIQGRFGNAFQPTSSAGVWTQAFSTVGMENRCTVEAWIKLTSQPTCDGCNFLALPWMNFNMNPDANFWFNLTLADWSGRGLWPQGNIALLVGKWQHVAFVFNSGNASLFLNGVLVASDSYGQALKTGSGNLNLVNYNAPDVFPGLIDEVRVSKVARAPSEFGLQLPPSNMTASQEGSSVHLQWSNGGGGIGCMEYRIYKGADSVNVSMIDSTTGTSYDDTQATIGTSYIYRVAAVDSTGFEGAMSRPVAISVCLPGEYHIDSSTVFLMHLNETGGLTATDVGPNAYHGQSNGGTFVSGRFGNGYHPGALGGMTLTTFSCVGLENASTLEVWMKLNERPQSYSRLISLPNMELAVNENYWFTYNFQLIDGSWRNIGVQMNSQVLGKWYHIAGTFDNGVVRLFVNGTCYNTKSYGQAAQTNQGSGCIGQSDNGTLDWVIDEARVSKTGWSPNDFDLPLSPKALSSSLVGSAVHLQWEDGGGQFPCKIYRIYRGPDSLNISVIDSTNALSYDDATISPGNQYCYRISAVDSTGFENNEGQNVFVSVQIVGEYEADTSTVLLMHLNQPGASVALDISGHGYHGQINGGSFADGRFGKAYQPATTNGISLSSIPSIGMENQATLEAWVKLDGPLNDRFDIISMPGLSFHLNSDYSVSLDFQLDDGNWTGMGTGSAQFAVGRWYHVACTCDNGVFNIFVDGIRRSTYSPGQSLKTSTGGGSVARMYSENSFSGLIDEVRISKVARQPSGFGFQFPPKNITASVSNSTVHLSWLNGGGGSPLMRYRIYRGTDSLFVTLLDSTTSTSFDDLSITGGEVYCYRVSAVDSSGFEISKGNSIYAISPLVGEYAVDTSTVLLMHFDQDSGATTSDVSPFGFRGQTNGGSFVEGRFGKAYQPTNDQGITLQNMPSTGMEEELTLEFWIKPTAYPNDWSGIVSMPTMNVHLNPDLSANFEFTLADGNGNGIGVSSNSLNIGKWHHVAATYKNGTARMYIDGVLCASRYCGQSLRIGTGGGGFAQSNGGNVLPAIVDELRISKVARQLGEFAFQLPPKDLTAMNIGADIRLAWQNGGGGVPCTQYKIYRGTDSVSTSVIDSTTGLTYDDASGQPGVFYFYRIASVDSTGFEGPRSIAVHAASQLVGEYASDTSTVLLMHMNHTGGLGIYDASSNGFHGQFSSGTFVPGRFGNGFQPGNSDGMWFNSISTVGMENEFTVELWVKFSDINKWGTNIISIPSIWLGISQDFSFNLNFNLADGSGVGAWSPSFVLSKDKWYHLAGVFDHGITKIYLNGVVMDSRYYDQSVRTSPGGGSVSSYNYPDVFPGIVDEVRISKGARSPEDFALQLPPKNLAVTPSPNSINLSWENGGGSIGCLRYKVYRGVDTVNLSLLDSTMTPSYSDTSAAVGTLYFYRVTAVDSTSFEGARSIAAKATMSSMGEYQPDSNTVLLYHMNGTSATTEFDASRFGNHGRLDRTSPAVGRFGKARQFDDQSYINLNYSASLNIGDSDFTLEEWIKASPQTNWICLMLKWESNHGMQLYLNGSSGTFAIQLQDESGSQHTVTGTSRLYDSRWHHVAAIRNNDTLSIYVDGSCEGSQDLTGLGSIQGLGGLSMQNGTYFLDEVRISNCARDPEEFNLQITPKNLQVSNFGTGVSLAWELSGGIVPLSNFRIYRGFDPNTLSPLDSTTSTSYQDGGLSAGAKYYYRVTAVDSTSFESAKCSAVSIINSLAAGEYSNDTSTVLLLHFDELYGSNVGDASASNNDGRASGTTLVKGRFGNARQFSSSDVVNVTSNAALNIGGGDFTVEGWLKSPSLSAQPMLFQKWGGDETGPGFKVFVNMTPPDGKVVFTYNDGVGSQGSSFSRSSVTDNKWHHIAAMRYGSSVKLYIDGELEATSSISGEGSFANDYDLNIGREFSSALIDEARISRKARVSNEFGMQLRPTNLTASVAATLITLSWQNGGGAISLMRYRIYRGADSTSMSLMDSTLAPLYVNSGLATGTLFYYRVTAVDSTGFESVKSYATNAKTQSIPLSPSSLTATPYSSSRIDLTWADKSDNEDGFKIDRKIGSSGTYTQIATVGANVASYQDTGLAPTTEYFYQVTAYNAAGASSPSTEISATTPEAPDIVAPGSPISPAISPVAWTSTHTYVISWTNPIDSSGIAKVWYRYDRMPTSDTLGTSLTVSVTGATASAQVPAPSTCGVHILYFYLEDGANPAGNKNPGSCVAVTVKHDDMCPTIHHDSLSVASFNTNDPKDVSISATANDIHSGLKTLVLYYREAGQPWSTARIVNFPSGGGTANIPASDITSFSNEGVDYRIVATDTADNREITPTHSLAIQHTESFTRADASGNPVPQMSVTQLQSGVSSQLAYRLFSVPLLLNNKTPRRVLEVETGLGSYNDVEWRFFRLNASDGYDEYPSFADEDAIEPGSAFFLILNSSRVPKAGPGTIVKSEDFNKTGIELKAGYNLVGNPFNFDVPIDSLSLSSNEPMNNRWEYVGVEGTNSGWSPGPTVLKPWSGILLKLNSAATLRFNIADRSGGAVPAGSFVLRTNGSKTQSTTGQPWRLKITAVRRDNGLKDGENLFGVDEQASDSLDMLDLCEPPMIGDKGLSLSSLSRGESLTHDFRKLGEDGYVWDLKLQTPDRAATVEVTIEGVDRLSDDVFLVDVDSKITYRPQFGEKITVNSGNGGRRFRLIVGNAEFAEENSLGVDIIPKKFVLYQNYPNPFNPETMIRYTIPNTNSAHRVILKVYNVLGNEIATLVERDQDAGYYEVRFDGKTFPSGTYFCRIAITNGKGALVFTDVKKLVLIK